jgi:dihydrofolate reductase
MASQNSTQQRRVTGNISLSLDGRINGPGGEYDMGWIGRHAITDAPRDLMARMTETTTTVLLGRKNYEGFGGFWPAVAEDENADPRDRAFSQWLDSVEKIAFSSTLKDAPWANSRIADGDPAQVVKELRDRDGGDIEVAGGGDRLFEDGIPASSWSLTDMTTTESGAMCLVYDRIRGEQ